MAQASSLCHLLSKPSKRDPSRWRFEGQPSIEGLWPLCRYTLANIESRKGVRQGDKVFQVGFGGGALPVHATSEVACMASRSTANSPTQKEHPRLLHLGYAHKPAHARVEY